MLCNDDYPRRIQFDKDQLLSDGTLSHAPNLGWIKLISDDGMVHDSRCYGVLKTTPRVAFAPQSGSVVQIPNRSEPMLTQNVMRASKSISVTIGVTDERIAENVLHDFCQNGKLIISTHPNLYYRVQVMDAAVSDGLSRHFSEVTIPYTASAFRYLLNEPMIKTDKLSDDGTIASGTVEFMTRYPHSAEGSKPKIYIVTQSGAQSDTIGIEISADGGETFRAEELAPSTVYCIDSERMSFYIYGTVDSDGNISKNAVFEDLTYKTIGDFCKIGKQKQHRIDYYGYISNIWIQPNARWNI